LDNFTDDIKLIIFEGLEFRINQVADAPLVI